MRPLNMVFPVLTLFERIKPGEVNVSIPGNTNVHNVWSMRNPLSGGRLLKLHIKAPLKLTALGISQWCWHPRMYSVSPSFSISPRVPGKQVWEHLLYFQLRHLKPPQPRHPGMLTLCCMEPYVWAHTPPRLVKLQHFSRCLTQPCPKWGPWTFQPEEREDWSLEFSPILHWLERVSQGQISSVRYSSPSNTRGAHLDGLVAARISCGAEICSMHLVSSDRETAENKPSYTHLLFIGKAVYNMITSWWIESDRQPKGKPENIN